ncbi:uncharacterized protein LOC107271654 isoform X2 [Cephus cinctus]|uniref:Uncharacterized protein LOC107271654 isoform X2 n=1 Tax=Cephus cinctus TaxID=211228 RepID=A0AAJ7W4U7_CEPCN|nr:uncharacterized protein LOC107271654 isoform X2 [Cephus cinctus]
MQNPRKRGASEDQEINSVIDRILWNDTKDARRCSKICNVEKKCCDSYGNESNQVNCAVESSARFSLKVMEALRNLQRNDQNKCKNSYCVNDIVNYIENNYSHDGDLYAQVLTVLPQICAQGFIVKTGSDEYYHVGPFACMINQNLKRELGNCPEACTGKSDDSCDDESFEDLGQISNIRKKTCDTWKKSRKTTCPSRSSATKRTNNPYMHCSQNRPDRLSRGSRRDNISRGKSKKYRNIFSDENQSEIELSSNDDSEKDGSSDENLFQGLESKKSNIPVGIINTDDKELKGWLRRCCRESEQQGTI